MIAELGIFSLTGTSVDFFHGGIMFKLEGLDAELDSFRIMFKLEGLDAELDSFRIMFRLEGLDATMTVGGTTEILPHQPPLIIPTVIRVVGGSIEDSRRVEALIKDEEEEIKLIVKLYMEHYYQEWL